MSTVADALPASAPRTGLIGGLRNVAIFFAALVAVSAALQSVRPFPNLTGIYRKYLHIADRREDYDAWFVGSSRFHHGIMPPRFDARVTALATHPLEATA